MDKVCGKCYIAKPKTEFYNNIAKIDGLQTYCKPCITLYNKKNKLPELVYTYKQRYYEEIHKLNKSDLDNLRGLINMEALCPKCNFDEIYGHKTNDMKCHYKGW